jgi:hypothetical protein
MGLYQIDPTRRSRLPLSVEAVEKPERLQNYLISKVAIHSVAQESCSEG